MTSSSKNNNSKPLKWTTQRVNNNIKSRVNKRTPPSNNNSNTRNVAAAIMTAEIKTNPTKEIERLQNELEFTYDTVATITVHFESLHHAYVCSKPELDKSKSATRLGEMEKELLTAYDDLGLQVTHLERKIAKLEKRLAQLRELESIYVSTPNTETSPKKVIQKQQVEEESPLMNDELNLISSPCSSTDSSVAECQLDTFYCNDWALSQVISNEEQPILYDHSSFPLLATGGCHNNNINTSNMMMMNNNYTMESTPQIDYYQELYCDLSMYNNNNEELFLSYPSYPIMQ